MAAERSMTTELKTAIYSYLEEIPDPEIPVLNIVDLGIVRAVENNGSSVKITITPTYTGCPAMKVIEEDILSVLKKKRN
jgi:ring-1,2-phenylacetyl-CoA epoxidase subunit PaaD